MLRTDLTSVTPPHPPTPHASRGNMIARIEDIFEALLDDIRVKREPTRAILILQLSHDALVSGKILTKRHIYYQHQDLFESQRVVDDLVDRVAKTLDARRDDLNIVATSKGVIAGPLVIELEDNTILDATSSDTGLHIPVARTIKGLDSSEINWILVVEKDAVFRSLCSSRYWANSLCGPGLLITAKGYPDDLTLSFLHHLRESDRNIPIVVLVDCDPDGLNIFRCYRYGSPGSGVPGNTGTHWLGIKTSHTLNPDTNTPGLVPIPATASYSQSSQPSSSQRSSISAAACRDPTTQLSQRDRRMAVGMLNRLQDTESADEQEIELMDELRIMLMLGVKAEIQWLDEAGSLSEWLDQEMTAFLKG